MLKLIIVPNFGDTMTIDLNRQFQVLDEKETSTQQLFDLLSITDGSLGWDELLENRRVVILAEAGNGKSAELMFQSEKLASNKKISFFSPLHEVAKCGLEDALYASDRVRYHDWKSSDQHAYIFLDSVDETKDAQFRLSTALKMVADAIDGAEDRCTIILSGRYTDWDFKDDLITLKKILKLPMEITSQKVVTSDEMLIQMLGREKLQENRETKIEEPVVVLMAQLNEARIKTFLEASNVQNCDQLLEQLKQGNLWELARTPLDLSWLSVYWEKNKKLGTLKQMVAIYLEERVRESDPHRQRSDLLEVDKVKDALNRIGAGLVLTRAANISTDPSLPDVENSSLLVFNLLPDWSDSAKVKLLSRPVFDPETHGRTRLKNDNNGAVRGYLCAQWLTQMMKKNLPKQNVKDLLFTEIYNVTVVRSSLMQTCAWLAANDTEIANDIAKIEPLVLMNYGDPASISPAVREKILELIVNNLSANRPLGDISRESLKRFFSTPLECKVITLWSNHRSSPSARELLLHGIWLGGYKSCLSIVEDALANYKDDNTRIFAGRALLNFADDDRKRNYATQIASDCYSLPDTVIADAIDDLFPVFLTIDNFISIVSVIYSEKHNGDNINLRGNAEKWANRINTLDENCQLLRELLATNQANSAKAYGPRIEKELIPLMISITRRIMELAPKSDIPDIVLKSALFLRNEERYGRLQSKFTYSGLLRNSKGRRRKLLWGISTKLKEEEYKRNEVDIWTIENVGIRLNLTLEDTDWLINDLKGLPSCEQKKIALNGLLMLWRDFGKDKELLDTITKATSPKLASIITEWTRTDVPAQETLNFQFEEERKKARENEKLETLRSWKKFIAFIKGDPCVLLNPMSIDGKIDVNLYNIYILITSANNRFHPSVYSLDPLKPLFGDEVVEIIDQAFSSYWKNLKPTARINRDQESRNNTFDIDLMGLIGLDLLSQHKEWYQELSDDEITKAIVFATLKLNGFPDWIVDVAHHKPNLFSSIILKIISAELLPENNDLNFSVHDKVSNSAKEVKQEVATGVLALIRNLNEIHDRPLSNLLSIAKSLPLLSHELLTICLEHFSNSSCQGNKVLYLSCAFNLNIEAALNTLEIFLSSAEASEKRSFVSGLLLTLFGNAFENGSLDVGTLTASQLIRLVTIAYDTIHPKDDIQRPSGIAFSPGERDNAQRARSVLFRALAEEPGEYTFRALEKFSELPDFGIDPVRMREIALNRAKEDANLSLWSPEDVVKFEETMSTAPRTSKDLCELILNHFKGHQDDLLNSEFAQGSTLAHLPCEKEVQIWICDRLSHSKSSYVLDREKHVVDEKKPDITARSRETGATVPIEVKVVESWTLPKLEEAVRGQLCGQYLRDKATRYGILLLVYQKKRSLGWENAKGEMFSFPQVVAHLENLVRSIRGQAENSAQPFIAVLDVTKARRKSKSKRRQSKFNAN